MKKAIFLDRDGTINVEKNYLFEIEKFEFLPGVIDGLRILEAAGFALIVVTNQSGIARGYYTEEDYLELESWMEKRLYEEGIHIEKSYYCPHHPEGKVNKYAIECSCRKPKDGLFVRAIRENAIDYSNSFAIGDRKRDVEICYNNEYPIKGGYVIYSNLETIENNIKYIRGGLFEAAMEIVKIDEYDN